MATLPATPRLPCRAGLLKQAPQAPLLQTVRVAVLSDVVTTGAAPHPCSVDYVDMVCHMAVGFLVKGSWLDDAILLFVFPAWNGNQTTHSS